MSRVEIKTETHYRIDTEDEVKAFIEEVKAGARAEGYTLAGYSSTVKQKKSKGEVVDEGRLVKVTKVFNDFWEV